MSDILIVDDDAKIARIMARYLEQAGYSCRQAGSGLETWQALRSHPFDLLILDILLPDTTGLQILKGLRHQVGGEQQRATAAKVTASPDNEPVLLTSPDVPVLILSALGMTDDIIGGLRSGADDYLVKPFEPRELVERVKALLRRQKRFERPPVRTLGNLCLDQAARLVSCSEQTLELTRREYDLLHFLAEHPGRVFERNELLDAVWGRDYDGSDRAVDLCVLRLRGKLAGAGASGIQIDTAWGAGYRLTIKDGTR